MYDFLNFKKNIVIFLFSVSIFLSFVNFYFLELRFFYLLTILFIFLDKNIFKKKFFNLAKISTIIFFTVLLHLFINNLFFKEIFFQFETFIQIFIISLSVFIIYYFKKVLLSNLRKIFDFFLYYFLIAILIYSVIDQGILFDTLYKCDLGFFYYTRFIFNENSHFAIIAIPVILNFIFNINYYFKNKILFILNLVFIFFAFGNFSLTFYLGSLFSIILIIVCYKNLNKLKISFLIIFILFTNIFLIYGSNINKFLSFDKNENCISQSENIVKKYNLQSDQNLFKGNVETPKEKLKNIFFKDVYNLSIGIHLYSIYVAKEALIQNPFGYGIHNYRNYRNLIDKNIKKEGTGLNEMLVFREAYMPKIFAPVINFNLNSGSNNFSKILVEFGIFGILLLIFYIIVIFSRKVPTNIKFLLLPTIFIQLFIRGTGYFNSGFLIISIFLIIIMIDRVFKK